LIDVVVSWLQNNVDQMKYDKKLKKYLVTKKTSSSEEKENKE